MNKLIKIISIIFSLLSYTVVMQISLGYKFNDIIGTEVNTQFKSKVVEKKNDKILSNRESLDISPPKNVIAFMGLNWRRGI